MRKFFLMVVAAIMTAMSVNAENGYEYRNAHVNWQVSVLGFEAGSSSLRGFVELGTCGQGIAVIGLRYKF